MVQVNRHGRNLVSKRKHSVSPRTAEAGRSATDPSQLAVRRHPNLTKGRPQGEEEERRYPRPEGSHSHTSHYNPLDEIRLGPYEVRDTQNIADLVVDPEGSAESRSHWQLTAHELLTATMLHLKYTSGAAQAPVPQTLAGCAQFLSDPRRPIHTTLQEMLNARHLPSGGHPLISSTARAMLDKAPEELSGVVSTALSYLSLYRDPLVAAATATSDFRILDLVEHSRPVTLYIAVPPSDLTRTRPLLRLFLNQLCRNLTQTLDPKRREVLFLLDEFPALRRLLFFVDSLAYLAGYKVRALTPAEVKRPLLTPDEVLRLPADDALLFLSGRPPVRATRARYYQDAELLRRSQLPPAALSQPLDLLPVKRTLK